MWNVHALSGEIETYDPKQTVVMANIIKTRVEENGDFII